jgi:hypothetical protein
VLQERAQKPAIHGWPHWPKADCSGQPYLAAAMLWAGNVLF